MKKKKTNLKDMKNQLVLQREEANSLMPEDKNRECHKIIHLASIASGGIGAGLAQVPGADAPAIIAIQVAMIQKLGKVFDVKLTNTSAETIIGTQLATITGRGLSQLLTGLIPVAGNIINASTASVITELLGWIVANSFNKEARKNH